MSPLTTAELDRIEIGVKSYMGTPQDPKAFEAAREYWNHTIRELDAREEAADRLKKQRELSLIAAMRMTHLLDRYARLNQIHGQYAACSQWDMEGMKRAYKAQKYANLTRRRIWEMAHESSKAGR